MKKLIPLIWLVLALVSLSALSADAETTPALWPAYDPITGLWGYIDEQGAWGIEPQWETALRFRNGYAIVDRGEDAEGLIDETGAYIFQPLYDLVTWGTIGFDSWVYNDVYVIYDNSLCGWFDSESGYISGLCWEHVNSWDDSPYVIAGVAGKETFVCRATGKRLLPLQDMSTYSFHDGYAMCFVEDGRDFIVDLEGNIAYLPEGLVADDVYLSEGLLLVEDENNLHGYVDAMGNVVIAPQYDDGGLFQNGYAVVEKNGEYLLINRENCVIAKGWYNVCGPWADGGIAVEGDGCWAVLNQDGTERFRIELESYEFGRDIRTYPPLVEKGPWWVGYRYGGVGIDFGLMTADGAWIVDASDGGNSYALADEMFSNDPMGWHAAWYQEKMGYIDGAGNTMLPFIYEDAGHFEGALARVMLDASTEGYINRAGEIVYQWPMP
ncbi:MAG: WG repeat-containing protein [Clostridia bacterium]|nr:WG repeat-containing protein [Clostridia bacterium]